MRKSAIIAALGAVWIIGGAVWPTATSAETITVLHGTSAEIVDTAKSPPGGVYLVRPAVAPEPAPAPAAETGPEDLLARDITVAGGDTLWMRQAGTGRLVACTVWNAGMVGEYVIRCTD